MKTSVSLAALLAAAPLPVAAAQHQGHSQHQMPAPAPAPEPAPAPAPSPAPHQHHMPAPSSTPVPSPAPSPSPAPHSHHQHGPAADQAAPPKRRPDTVSASGTALLPAAEGGMHDGLHLMAGDWMVMAHGYLWGVVTDQGGPRGDDMAFVQSMGMVTASRPLGDRARIEFKTMFSLEPLMGRRGYPNLLATGETAFGQALVDRQHPHDLFMELAARVEVDVGADTTAFLYGGPVGEPALGPPAFMHRRSARYQPMSPISHHWFDSTHITYGVATAGVRTRAFQLEGSLFTGREPDEERWGIDTPKFDSWSFRATLTPSPNWAMQVSHGRLKAPEALHGGDEARTTASVHYAKDGLSAMLAFSAKNRIPGDTLTAWLGEVNWDIDRHHSLFGRVEVTQNSELFPDHTHPLHDQAFRVARFEGGYAYRIPLAKSLDLALGGTVAAYAMPAALDPFYGKSPVSATGFARLSLGS